MPMFATAHMAEWDARAQLAETAAHRRRICPAVQPDGGVGVRRRFDEVGRGTGRRDLPAAESQRMLSVRH